MTSLKTNDVSRVLRYVRSLKNEIPFHTTQNGVIMRYKMYHGIWLNDGENYIKKWVTQMLLGESYFKSSIVREVVTAIRGSSYDDSVEMGAVKDTIVVANGRLNVLTGEFSSVHKMNEYHITRLPVKYDKDAKCPVFDEFLPQVIDDEDDRLAVLEYMGYMLYKKHFIESFLIFLGKGENGKSTLINVIKSVIGPENVSSSSIQELATSRFRTADLRGKMANISADIPSSKVDVTGVLKALTGGDSIQAERKGEHSFSFVSYAKLMFSANVLPATDDTSNAFFRRTRVIEFPHSFNKESGKRDPHMSKKLTTTEERSGILNLMVEGLQRLTARGYLCADKTTHEKKMRWIKRSDSIQYFADTFLEQYHQPDSDGTKASQIYEWYLKVTKVMEIRPVSQNMFGREIKRHLQYAEKVKKRVDGGNPQWYWEGCVIKFGDISDLEDALKVK